MGGPPRPWPPAGVDATAVEVGDNYAVFKGDPAIMAHMVMVGPCAQYFSKGWSYNFQAVPISSNDAVGSSGEGTQST